MDESREAAYLSKRFNESLERRQKAARAWNENLHKARPGWRKRLLWRIKAMRYGKDHAGRLAALEAEWRSCSGRRRGSIAWALNDVMVGFWAGGESTLN